MLRHTEYTRDRIHQLVERLQAKIYPSRQWIDNLQVCGPVGRISHAEVQHLTDWRPAKAGDQYGPVWATFWFRSKATIPREWKGKRVDFLWDTRSEATLWIDGRSVQGLNMGSGDRPDAVLIEKAAGGESLEWQVEMACNGAFGNSTDGSALIENAISPYALHRAEIAVFDPAAWELYQDAVLLSDLYRELERDGDVSEKAFAGKLLIELNRFCNVIDLEARETWPDAGAILKDLYKNHNGSCQFQLGAIGHAHIDTAWLWPLVETRRKCERTFSSATTYMKDYPEYRFACSQAYQYSVIKERNADLYRRIKERVKTGQWVIVGGTWIEPDCNIPSGESLCRQFLFGQRFFYREFGIRCKEFWNPDVFGYNGQLPQIMNLAGIKRFLTQKLSWNRMNKPEHHTFTWQGIDGSEVLAHFPPADSYNVFMYEPGHSHVTWLRRNIKLHKDHDRAGRGLMLYGWGDGGGGPTKSMLETIRRAADIQGIPRTTQQTSDEFFTLLEKEVTDRPLQIGELYFEYHRGTYTSQAMVKKNNRKAENLLHDLEFVATASGKPYPRDAINKLWEILLLNQFHDILPGSSIGEVYKDSAAQFSQLFESGEDLILKQVGSGESLLNTIGFSRTDVVERNGHLEIYKSPPFASASLARSSDAVAVHQDGDQYVLENRQLKATFRSDGTLVSLVHIETGRETLAGAANRFEMYDDKPTAFDAWDIDPYHLETRKNTSPADKAQIVRSNPLRCELGFSWKIGKKSRLTQTVRLDAESRRLEFLCLVEWAEVQTTLKVAFPVNARHMTATYEMQFGNVERPTHYNSSFDLAKYEVPYHKWFDLSEHGFGCAVLTDCKYGGSVFGNTMRITLLRSPISPDPNCDQGHHEFGYALFQHGGGWREAGVVAEAYRYNNPLRSVGSAAKVSFVNIEDPNIVIDTVKRAEDSDAIVIRLYECHGARGTAGLRINRPISKATFCNILEEDLADASFSGEFVEIPYTPYKIISLKLS